jgi:hypothetical protein
MPIVRGTISSSTSAPKELSIQLFPSSGDRLRLLRTVTASPPAIYRDARCRAGLTFTALPRQAPPFLQSATSHFADCRNNHVGADDKFRPCNRPGSCDRPRGGSLARTHRVPSRCLFLQPLRSQETRWRCPLRCSHFPDSRHFISRPSADDAASLAPSRSCCAQRRRNIAAADHATSPTLGLCPDSLPPGRCCHYPIQLLAWNAEP